ncbi:MAG TPA: apolipoprotein N-acyltransferase [Steroidobacteraceae bacterium]|nr:apolipoprotein N-acyltransferase [Steroidobacteraceae bacterium]
MALYTLPRPSSARLRALIALVAGAALAAAFAPLSLWPLAVLCPALLMWLWQDAAPREAAWLGFLFNAGTFGAGTYWLLISLPIGGAPVWLALFLMLGLTGIMALYHAALGYGCARWLPRQGAARSLVALPAAWLLVEWWRGWFLSGFSWLSLGYSQTDTWLAGLAPVTGVYGVSAALLLCAGALTALVGGTRWARASAAAALLVPWAAGAALRGISWTHPSGAPVSVAIAQGAVPQDEKWLETNRDATLDLYQKLTEQAFGTALIVWPESAPADTANDLVPWLSRIYRDAHAHGSALVMGILRAEGGVSDSDPVRYYNSVLALDAQVGWYDKHHLVPFAEFFPVPQFVRSWMRLASLPYSDFTRGAAYQPPLEAAHLKLGATVCYEDGYGSSMLEVLRRGGADALVNVTNDAWFGHSSARHQHFQIARMRALEEGRYMIRAANDGISAVIGPHGEVMARAPEFRPVVLVSQVIPLTGLTPYAHVGNWLVLSLATLALAYGLWVRNDRLWRTRSGSAAAAA